MKNTINSRKLYELAGTYVVNGECVKSRKYIPETVTSNEVQRMIANYENIVIQENEEIKIYCDDKFLDIFNFHINGTIDTDLSSKRLHEAYEKGKLEFFVKYSNNTKTKDVEQLIETHIMKLLKEVIKETIKDIM